MPEIGQRSSLRVLRNAAPGVYLDGGELGDILLPNRYVPRHVLPGDYLSVFIYRDSLDRLVATTERPKAAVGETVKLKVLAIHPEIGAFLDWGLPKDLLLPFREQTAPVWVGLEVLVRICLDPKSQRIIASMRLEPESASPPPAAAVPAARGAYRKGQAVSFTLTEETPLGFKALVNGTDTGLLYHDNIAIPVKVGQRLNGFIRELRPDGKIDLSLEEAGYAKVGPLATRIIKALKLNKGKLNVDDDTPPELIRRQFGASKKAFKQALGTLYKAKRIRFTRPGIELTEGRPS